MSLGGDVVKYIEKQKGDVKDTLADTDKIGKLGWKPRVESRKGSEDLLGGMGREFERLRSS